MTIRKSCQKNSPKNLIGINTGAMFDKKNNSFNKKVRVETINNCFYLDDSGTPTNLTRN